CEPRPRAGAPAHFARDRAHGACGCRAAAPRRAELVRHRRAHPGIREPRWWNHVGSCVRGRRIRGHSVGHPTAGRGDIHSMGVLPLHVALALALIGSLTTLPAALARVDRTGTLGFETSGESLADWNVNGSGTVFL